MGQLKPTFEIGAHGWNSTQANLTIMPLQFGMRYLLQAHAKVHLWVGAFFHGDFAFGTAALAEHHVGGLGAGGVELRLGRLVLGVESGYRFSQNGYSNLVVAAKVGFSVGRMGRSGTH